MDILDASEDSLSLALLPEEDLEETAKTGVAEGLGSTSFSKPSSTESLRNAVTLLREEKLRAEALLARTHSDYVKLVSGLQEQLLKVTEEKNTIGLEAERDRQKQAHELKQLELKIEELETQSPLLREKVTDIKEALQDLEIGEATYISLKGKPETSLSLKDFCLLRVHEYCGNIVRDRNGWRRDAEKTHSEVTSVQAELRHQQVEFESMLRGAKEQIRGLGEQLDSERSSAVRGRSDASKWRAECEALRFKAVLYDKVKDEIEELRAIAAKSTQLQKDNEQLGALARRAEEDKTASLSDLQRKLEILQMDKQYLQKQLEDGRVQQATADEQVENLRARVRELKHAREDLTQQILRNQDGQRIDYEARLQAELQQLRSRTHSEIAEIKAQAAQALEREAASLREARDIALQEKASLQAQVRELVSDNERLRADATGAATGAESRVSEISSQLRLKCFELERVNVLHEAATASLERARGDIERGRRKLEIVSSEYYSLRRATEQRIRELEEAAKERDNILLQLDQLDEPSTTGPLQKMKMAHSEKQVSELRNVIDSLQKELSTCRDEVQKANILVENSRQPQRFLIMTIRQKDEAISQQQAAIAELQLQVQQLEKEKQIALEQRRQVQATTGSIETLRRGMDQLASKLENTRADSCIAIAPASGPDAFSRLEQESGKLQITSAPFWYQRLKQQQSKLQGEQTKVSNTLSLLASYNS